MGAVVTRQVVAFGQALFMIGHPSGLYGQTIAPERAEKVHTLAAVSMWWHCVIVSYWYRLRFASGAMPLGQYVANQQSVWHNGLMQSWLSAKCADVDFGAMMGRLYSADNIKNSIFLGIQKIVCIFAYLKKILDL